MHETSTGFIASGGGRGPLSTTILMDALSVDPVPTIDDQTVRVMLRTTAAGRQVMVKLTNRYSTEPLTIDAAHMALRDRDGAIAVNTDRMILFGGSPMVRMGAGAETWSDPVDLAVARGDTIAISLYVKARVTPATQSGRCNLSWMTHYISRHGDYTSHMNMPPATPGPSTTHTILFVAEVRVRPPGRAATIVTLGDSITEGACSTVENGDWPDLLSDRLPTLPDGTAVSVFNAGIGSGRLLSDGAGLRGILRLEEILKLPRVRWITVLMGVNDISYEHADAAAFISAYRGAIERAHAAGVKLIGIPILPFRGSYKDVGVNWATAESVNAWIRSPSSGFDAIIDFEPVLGDPARPGYLRSDLTQEGVHPNQAGQTAMADSIDLTIFR